MQLEPLIPQLVASGRLRVDFDTGLIYSPKSNTPDKPLGAITKKGYLRVCLNIEGKQAHALAHRIVWAAMHGPVPDGLQIDHRDTIKTHNWIKNLEAVTGAKNMARAAQNGLTNGGWRDGPRDPKTGRFVGKRAAGRLLDGRTWDELPEACS